METISKYTVAFGASLAITSILSALLVVVKELNENSVLAWMKGLTSHHWITHGLFMVIAFFAIGWGLAKLNNGDGLKMTPDRLVWVITSGVVIGGLIISGFYLVS
ncbi:MAG: hypothetical protein EHM38_08770 [Geobacteraceae bacterium]|jgi:hypothetical protein|nr:MAG: hypothetical protein EHM38_08770 [Geobacteraceae bacterium]